MRVEMLRRRGVLPEAGGEDEGSEHGEELTNVSRQRLDKRWPSVITSS